MNTSLTTSADKPCVMVIDDELSIRTVLKLLFEERFRVLECQDGPSAIAVVKSNPGLVTAAIVDFSMSTMNGDIVCKCIQSLDSTISLIGFTGSEQASFKTSLYAYRVKKHTSNKELLELVDDAVAAAEHVRSRKASTHVP